MSYPSVRYLHSAGALEAAFRPGSQPAELPDAPGGDLHYLVRSAEVGLYRWDFGPEPSGPAPHFHRTFSESFYVLSGSMRIHDGRRWLEAGPDDLLHAPAGSVHGFRNESGARARMLVMFAPGAPREAFFEELAGLAGSGRDVGPEEWGELYARHDQYMV
ncbi:MAG: cupin domain-containing protein [Phycicoccus sp.]